MLPIMRTKVKFDEKTIDTFRGINTGENAKGGELAYSMNMSAHKFPSLSSRKKRCVPAQTSDIINGLGMQSGYIYTHYNKDTHKIYLNFEGEDYEYTSYTDSEDFSQTRNFASLADCILIIPDNIIFFVKTKMFSKINVSQIHNSNTALEKFKKESNGSNLMNNQNMAYVATVSHNKITCRYTGYTSSGTHDFYYSSFDSTLKDGDVITVRMRVYVERIGDENEYYEYVDKMNKDTVLKIKSCVSKTHTTVSGTISETVELLFDDHSIDDGGYTDIRIEELHVERKIPALEKMCSLNNRIWAISGNRIYTSKLGDASEWNDYSVDDYGTLPYACYTASSQTEGDFTAIVPYGNYIYAFKDNVIHKIYGNSPDEYKMYTENFVGTGGDGGDCVRTYSGGIIYASYDGIYHYGGDYPRKISESVEIDGKVICAASNENCYYLLAGTDSGTELFVYDIKKNLWHRENAPEGSRYMCAHANKVYLATQNQIICLNSSDNSDEYERYVTWKFRIKFDEKDFGKKGFGQLSMRYSLGKGATFTVQAIYDDKSLGAVCGACFDEAADAGYMLNMPVKRCNWFVLEFRGMGEFKLKSMKLKFYRGSEI